MVHRNTLQVHFRFPSKKHLFSTTSYWTHYDLIIKKNALPIHRTQHRTSTYWSPFNNFIWLTHKIVSPRLWSYKRKYNIYGHAAAQFINIASLCPVSHKSAGRWNRFKVVVGCCMRVHVLLLYHIRAVSLLLRHNNTSRVGRQRDKFPANATKTKYKILSSHASHQPPFFLRGHLRWERLSNL